MLKIEIISVGKLKEKYLLQACDEYKKRLLSFTKIVETNVNEVKISENPSQKEINQGIEKEGNIILGKLNPSALVISLAIEGKQLSSEELSKYIYNKSLQGKAHVQLIIGSSFGLDKRVKDVSDLNLSFSKMTFPHQLMKVILYEQIYRVFSIMKNTKYHK